MSEHFCTYFDHRYATKGLAMWRSLKHHCAGATLHVLCLSETCREILEGLHLPDVHLYPLSALETADPDLLEARGTRSLIEYYFTLTPCFPLYLLKTRPEMPRLTYVDADLFFLGNPQPILDEIGDNSIGIIEHRFATDLEDHQIYGRFNVGWLTFTGDAHARECLEVWREQCIAWCYDRLESGRFAEQKYLDEWPRRFKGVRIIEHRGANVAPWNLNRFEISDQGGEVRVGGDCLIFYHAHGFEAKSPGRPRRFNLKKYGVEDTPLLVRSIFDPYESALLSATTEIAVPLALALTSERSRETAFLVETLKLKVAYLGGQLSTSEAERTVAASAIQALRTELAASHAERAVQGATVQTLQGQLESSIAELAMQADSIRALKAQLAESDAASAAKADLLTALEAQLAAAEARAGEMRTLWEQTRKDREMLYNSLSWRWTRPLRVVKDSMARIFARA